jgi:hypothetical protein
LGAFQENIIIGVNASTYLVRRLDPDANLSDGSKHIRDFVFAPLEARAVDHFFVLRIDFRAHAKAGRRAPSGQQ